MNRYLHFLPLLFRLCLLWALCSLASAAVADNTGPRPHLDIPFVTVTPLMTADPADPAWASAADITQLTPSLGSVPVAPLPPTTIRLLWSAKYLYIRFQCEASDIYSPYKNNGDPLYQGDVDEVFLDAQGDGRQWIEIEVSPFNITFQILTTLTTDPKSDPSSLILLSSILDRDYWPIRGWSLEGLKTSSRIVKSGGKDTGWITDIALPAVATLHRRGQDSFTPMELRANFLRYDYPRQPATNNRQLVASDWASVMFGCPHISPSAMGYLELK